MFDGFFTIFNAHSGSISLLIVSSMMLLAGVYFFRSLFQRSDASREVLQLVLVIFMFPTLTMMGHYNIVDSEVISALIGALLGYVFASKGQQQA